MEAQTTVSYSTQCGLFISEYKKYTVSGVTSFEVQLFINKPISGGGGGGYYHKPVNTVLVQIRGI